MPNPNFEASNKTLPSESIARAPTIDLAATLCRLRGSQQLLRELIGFYMADYPALLAKLVQGIEEHNKQEAKRNAHKLHGLAASFDGQTAAALAMEVETLVSNQQFAYAARTLAALERSLNDVAEALKSQPVVERFDSD